MRLPALSTLTIPVIRKLFQVITLRVKGTLIPRDGVPVERNEKVRAGSSTWGCGGVWDQSVKVTHLEKCAE